jgi:RsiW-degrading membrane proteinase PrsW (M82 family)
MTFAEILFSLLLGLVPLLAYTLFIWWLDQFEQEPLPLIAAAFLWGFLPAALFSVLLENLLDQSLRQLLEPAGLAFRLSSMSLFTPLVEEALKGLGLLLMIALFGQEVDTPLDGLVYGAVIGFGFGSIENMLYIASGASLPELLRIGILRSFLFGLNHALFTGTLGLALGWAHTRGKSVWRLAIPFAGFLVAVVLHGVHNAGLSLVEVSPMAVFLSLISDGLGVLALLSLILLFLIRESQILRTELFGEVEAGNLSESEYRRVSTWNVRTASLLGFILELNVRGWRQERKYQLACAKLAFAIRRGSATGRGAATVDKLRAQVSELRIGANET